MLGGGLEGEGTEFTLVVGCILFGMHFSLSKNALLLNFSLYDEN